MGASASREKFRESVSSLVEVDVSPDDAEFWDELWKIPSTGEEVFELIPPAAARRLRDARRGKIRCAPAAAVGAITREEFLAKKQQLLSLV